MTIFAIALAFGFAMYALWQWEKDRKQAEAHRLAAENQRRLYASYVTVADLEIMRQAGLTLREWEALTREQRADIRWRSGIR